jgi:hypothetical protein
VIRPLRRLHRHVLVVLLAVLVMAAVLAALNPPVAVLVDRLPQP